MLSVSYLQTKQVSSNEQIHTNLVKDHLSWLMCETTTKKIVIYIFVAEVDQKRKQLSKSIHHKLSSTLRVNVNKNHRLSKKLRTRSKIDLVHFLPVGSLNY